MEKITGQTGRKDGLKTPKGKSRSKALRTKLLFNRGRGLDFRRSQRHDC